MVVCDSARYGFVFHHPRGKCHVVAFGDVVEIKHAGDDEHDEKDENDEKTSECNNISEMDKAFTVPGIAVYKEKEDTKTYGNAYEY